MKILQISFYLLLALSTAAMAQTQTAAKDLKLAKPLAEHQLVDKAQLPSDFNKCGLSKKARQLAKFILKDDEQQRKVVNCNPLLAELAAKQAKALADAGQVSHFVGGVPNQRLAKAGFPLTELDLNRDNSVEAILGGEATAEDAWLRFQMSYSHKTHLLGEHEFYLKQTEFAVGYYYKWHSPHIDYWVVYFAEAANQTENSKVE